MTMTVWQSVITIGAVVLGTVLTRFLPFWLFPEGKRPPKFVLYLGRVLPGAAIGMLVVYCLKDAVFTAWHGLPELLAGTAVVLSYLWKRNTLISIGAGTVFYMFLIQFVFA